eukprot:2609878-Ditylum_brightwellii.AAC.1
MEEDGSEILNFNVTTTVKQFKDKSNRVEATVFGIECAEEDADYLKTLLSVAYKNYYFTTGTSIPTA